MAEKDSRDQVQYYGTAANLSVWLARQPVETVVAAWRLAALMAKG